MSRDVILNKMLAVVFRQVFSLYHGVVDWDTGNYGNELGVLVLSHTERVFSDWFPLHLNVGVLPVDERNSQLQFCLPDKVMTSQQFSVCFLVPVSLASVGPCTERLYLLIAPTAHAQTINIRHACSHLPLHDQLQDHLSCFLHVYNTMTAQILVFP